jgi:hypothetical protein
MHLQSRVKDAEGRKSGWKYVHTDRYKLIQEGRKGCGRGGAYLALGGEHLVGLRYVLGVLHAAHTNSREK